MFQTLTRAWIKERQDCNSIFEQRSRLSSLLEHNLKQEEIQYKYPNKDLDQTPSLDINQSQAIFNSSTQTQIEIKYRAQL